LRVPLIITIGIAFVLSPARSRSINSPPYQTGVQLRAAVMADASAPLTRDPHSPSRDLRSSVVPSAPRTAE
jgi:hypothetical protein